MNVLRASERREAIAAYKTLLRKFIDRRPSGLRGRLARALGKHKSFISQITNPGYSVPIPAGDLATIFEICHLTPEEREQFLRLYEQAHPRGARRAPRKAAPPHELRIRMPAFRSTETAIEVEATIREFANRVIRLAQMAERADEEAKAAHPAEGEEP